MMDRRKGTTRSAAAAVALLIAMLAPSAQAARIPDPNAPTSRALTDGVVYKVYKVSGPNRVRVLTIDPERATIDVALAGPQFPSWSRTSTMATAHDAVAAVNGDFGLSPGRPAHLFAEDGSLVQTAVLGADGKNFGVDIDGSGAWADNPQVRINATHVTTGNVIAIDNWNDGAPRASEASMFSAEGGSIERPTYGCSARLMPQAAPRWNAGRDAVTRTYTVAANGCGASMTLGGGIVLVGQNDTPKGNQIRAMRNGDTVEVSWGLGWRGVVDSIGGSPVLLHNGTVKVNNCNEYLCYRHPRTAVGVKANGDVMFVQVDGRSSASVGMTLVQLAQEMKRRGAVDAINLDGGGSSTMWIRGSGVVNRPSDGSERAVSTALLVLPGRDDGDPAPLLSRPTLGAPVSTGVPILDQAMAVADAESGFEAAVEDPASIGGLLDYLDHEDQLAQDPELESLLTAFREDG